MLSPEEMRMIAVRYATVVTRALGFFGDYALDFGAVDDCVARRHHRHGRIVGRQRRARQNQRAERQCNREGWPTLTSLSPDRYASTLGARRLHPANGRANRKHQPEAAAPGAARLPRRRHNLRPIQR